MSPVLLGLLGIMVPVPVIAWTAWRCWRDLRADSPVCPTVARGRRGWLWDSSTDLPTWEWTA